MKKEEGKILAAALLSKLDGESGDLLNRLEDHTVVEEEDVVVLRNSRGHAVLVLHKDDYVEIMSALRKGQSE